ncbi:F0F1 ATP synthase subunit B [Puniceicoccaceae bacterium K14]|nr:F0F1 ATP synthase subunit B [Puniceicoccaceae bacterium K14]
MLDLIYVIAAADPHAASESIPEKFGLEWQYIGMQVFSFLVLTAILWKFGFKPVLSTIDERQKKIEDGLNYADDMKAKLADAEAQSAAAIQKASQEAQVIVDDARKIAEDKIAKATQEAAGKTEEMLGKANKQIDMDRKQMIDEARSEIARLVVDTTAKVLAKELTPEEKSRFADSASTTLTGQSN